MTLRRSKHAAFGILTLSALGIFLGCENDNPSYYPDPYPPDETMPPDEDVPPFPQGCTTMPACDGTIQVASDGPALLLTDPQILAEVPLQKVVNQILTLHDSPLDANGMMQRLFDTMNTKAGGKFTDAYHCDDSAQPAYMFANGDTFTCPRAEGALASSTGFFTAGDPDSFFPVAIVNRFDLTPVDGMTCGQYRIVYAKQSGLVDPANRVFLIFEAALPSPAPGCLEACRPVAEFWKGLEGRDPAQIAAQIDQFFFTGLPGFLPAVHPQSYGLGSKEGGYGHETGQVRVSMHMQDPWDMRELRLDFAPESGQVVFTPATVKNNPAPAFFDPANGSWAATSLRDGFATLSLPGLAGADVASIQMFTPMELNGVESALGGANINDYHTAATAGGDMTFVDGLDSSLFSMGYGDGCPPDDPLDAEAILNRATALSCAGCHAPAEMLGPTRSIGCGLTWPDSIGQAHITETSALSPALTDVFLPHRAQVMATFLQACDMDAILGNFPSGQMGGPGGVPPVKVLTPGRTLGGSTTH